MNIFLTFNDTGKAFGEQLAAHIRKRGYTVTEYLHNGLPDDEYDALSILVEQADCAIVIESPYLGYAYPQSHPMDVIRRVGKPTIPVIYEPDLTVSYRQTKPPVPIRVIFSRDNTAAKKRPYMVGLPTIELRHDDVDPIAAVLTALEQVGEKQSAWESGDYLSLAGSRWHVTPLLRVAANDQAENRAAAAAALAQSDVLIDDYIELLSHSYVGIRQNAARTLARLFPLSLPALLEVLRHPTKRFLVWPVPSRHESMGRIVVDGLQAVNPPDLENTLWSYVRSTNPEQQRAAKYALLRLRFHQLYKEGLRYSLFDPDDKERALANIDDLMPRLSTEYLDVDNLLDLSGDPSQVVTDFAVIALCGLRDPKALLPFMYQNYFYYASSFGLRNFALHHLADESHVPELIERIKTPHFRIEKALGVLEYIGTPEAKEAVTAWFAQKNPEEAQEVRKEMRQLGSGEWK